MKAVPLTERTSGITVVGLYFVLGTCKRDACTALLALYEITILVSHAI